MKILDYKCLNSNEKRNGEIMGLLDKFKDLFTEPDDSEEEEEIKVEQIKKEPSRVSSEARISERRKEHREHVVEEKKEPVVEEKEEKIEKEPPKLREQVVKTPVFFTENDFADLEPEKPKRVERKIEPESRIAKREEKKQPYSGNYSGTYTSTSILTKEKPTFKPTPIISPIYGILDKNYSKDDIVEKNKSNKPTTSSDGMTNDQFDEIRNKAYGTLENELENTMYEENTNSRVKRNKHLEEEIDLFDELEQQENNAKIGAPADLAKTVNEQEKNIRELEEITMDLTKELDNLLLKKESYNKKKDKVVIKEQEEMDNTPLTENELFNLIDSMYEEGKE